MESDGPGATRPDFFIVGAPRCGTSSISHWLDQHPEVFVSTPKEPHFFGSDLHTDAFTQFFGRRTQAEYLELFSAATPGQRVGEGSVWYLSSQSAATELLEFNPKAKIIIMLRNPLDMMRSLHSKLVQTHNEDITHFPDALAAESDRRAGSRIPATAWHPDGLLYTEVASFSGQVARFLDVFEDEAVHFVIFDDLARDPAAAYRDIARFLHVDTAFTPNFKVYNKQREQKKAGGFKRSLSRIKRRSVAFLPAGVRVSMARSRSVEKAARVQRMFEETPDHVLDQLATDCRRLSALLDRDLTYWLDPGRTSPQ